MFYYLTNSGYLTSIKQLDEYTEVTKEEYQLGIQAIEKAYQEELKQEEEYRKMEEENGNSETETE